MRLFPFPRMGLSGFKHNFALRVTLLQISIGIANVGQGIDLGDRDLEAAGGEHAGELGEHLGARRRLAPSLFTPYFSAAANR